MKKFAFATIPLLCAAISLSADSCAPKKPKPTCPPPKPTPEECCITPSANPMVTHWADPYITADFIWWRAQEDGLVYAFDGASTTPGVSASKGRIHQPRFKYEPGFKVGFGLKFRHDGWDFYSNYTWLQTNSDQTKRTTHKPASSSLISNYLIEGTVPAFVSIANEAKANWSLHFNALDLELGRNFWISRWLTLRPQFGLKFSWIKQNYHVQYEDASTVTGSGLADANIRLHNEQRQWGLGIRTGLDAAWYMWRKWCIYGEFDFTALWNSMHITRKDTTSSPDTESFTSLNTKRRNHPVTAILELGLGLRFETTFHNDDYLFMLQAGWEDQIWFDHNELFFINSQAPSNLTFEGLTIKAGFDF